VKKEAGYVAMRGELVGGSMTQKTDATDHGLVAAEPDGLHRRKVLAGALGVGAAAVVLAACGSDNAAPSPEPSSPADQEPAPGATTASGVIVAAADVPVDGGVVEIVDDRKVIVTQPEAGTYKGFSAVCPHEGCTVAGVQEGSIFCPCHGSRFDTSTGAVLQGPATVPLAPVPVAQQGDDIVFA
jgi:Rieske Fe-S protein